jgi:hypothetical protein
MKGVSAHEEFGDLAYTSPGSRSRRGLGRFLEDNGTVVVVVGAFAMVMLTTLRTGLAADGWLALVAGREIVQHGLPSHDSLTLWTVGRRWTDQQWLAQITIYGLWRLAGLKLALLVHTFLAVGSLAAAAGLARRLGASARSATWIAIPVLICYYPAAAVLRPQTLAYPLFVSVFWLLACDAREPTRRVFATLPLLVLWANLHGSAILGAGLVCLAGLVQVVSRFVRERRLAGRGVALVVLAPACLLASPYAPHLPGYYEKVVVGSGFGSFVTEWQPTTLDLVNAPFYLLVLGGIWLIARCGQRLTAFEKLAFLVVAVLGFEANRNITWLALTALAVLPVALDDLRPAPPEPRRLNRMLSIVVTAGTLVAVAGVAANGDSWFVHDFPPAAAAAASRSAGPEGTVFATSSYADWLLWTHPELAGRVAYDSRFELLKRSELLRAQRFQVRVEGWRQIATRYPVLVIDRNDDKELRDSLVRLGLARVIRVYQDVVVLRTTAADRS